MFETQLEKAAFSQKEERAQMIQELAHYPDALQKAIHVLNYPKKVYWEVATQVIRAIGYPRNAEAIPPLIAHVGDQNSLAWKEAVQALVDMGPQVVVPHLMLSLWDQDRHEYWGGDVEGICSMLYYELEQEYAKQCGPLLSYILSRDDLPPPHDLDRGFLLNVLEKIGNDCAEYSLPTLIDFVRKEGESDVGKQAQRLIASFSEEVLRPYKYLLTPHSYPNPNETSPKGKTINQ